MPRLSNAPVGTDGWGLSFSYDGFGNRTAQTVTKGSAPAWNELVDSSKNRVVGYYDQYDANGNLTRTAWPGSGESAGLTYDHLNRLTRVVSPDGNEQYEYTPGGDRIYRRLETDTETEEWYYFYGADGRLLAAYKQNGDQAFDLRLQQRKTYFMGKLTHEWRQTGGDQLAVVDRLGSLRHSWMSWSASYYPYGEEQGAGTADDDEKFATYFRDSFTGFDYARQRYYSSRTGRFLTPDPYRASGGAADPGSWNRYAYVMGDPVNFGDPSGMLIMPEPYLGVGIYCTNVWGAEGSSYECSPEFAYIMSYFGPAYLAQETQGGGGGGSGPESTVVDGMRFIDVRTDGSHQDLINLTIAGIRAAIDDDCRAWLQTGIGKDFNHFLDQVSISIGHAANILDERTPGGKINALTGSGVNELSIIVSRTGAFYQNSLNTNNNRLAGNTDRARVFILLHEFAHANFVPGFESDRGSLGAGRRNNNTVQRHCGDTLRRFGRNHWWSP